MTEPAPGISGYGHVPHGQTSCLRRPHTLEINRPFAAERLALAGEAAIEKVAPLEKPGPSPVFPRSLGGSNGHGKVCLWTCLTSTGELLCW
jgi:hypothetical protein